MISFMKTALSETGGLYYALEDEDNMKREAVGELCSFVHFLQLGHMLFSGAQRNLDDPQHAQVFRGTSKREAEEMKSLVCQREKYNFVTDH